MVRRRAARSFVIRPGEAVFALDTTRPEVQAWLFDVFRALKKAGFDYFKVDFLFAAAMAGSRLRNVTPIQATAKGEVIRRAVGRSFVLGCGAPCSLRPDSSTACASARTRLLLENQRLAVRGAQRYFALRTLSAQFLHRSLWLNDPTVFFSVAGHRTHGGRARNVRPGGRGHGQHDPRERRPGPRGRIGKTNAAPALGSAAEGRRPQTVETTTSTLSRRRADRPERHLAVNLADGPRSAGGREVPPRSASNSGTLTLIHFLSPELSYPQPSKRPSAEVYLLPKF